jgi:hypothetical protein
MEDYKKKYEEALKRAKYYKEGITDRKLEKGENIMDYIFPELAESEDERIREVVILTIKSQGFISDEETLQQCVAWLEKQEHNGKKWIYEDDYIKEKEQLFQDGIDEVLENPQRYGLEKKPKHFELKAGHWYICHRAFCCRADHLTVKEGERFMCEKDGVVKGFVFKDPEEYFVEVCAPAPFKDEQKPYPETLDKAIELYYYSYGNGKEGFNNISLEQFKDIIKTFVKDYGNNLAWSEEDERICQCLIENQDEALDEVRNDKYGHSEIISDLKEMYYERINWLKSLKERMKGE